MMTCSAVLLKHTLQSVLSHVSTGQDAGWTLEEAGSEREKSWRRNDLHVVLVHPQIPQNSGNVSRTCAATGVSLHLVGPLGFKIDDKLLKRAGLDYWSFVCVKVHEDIDAFLKFFEEEVEGPKRLIAFSKFSKVGYSEPSFRYEQGDWLMFGAETTGLPEVAVAAARRTGEVVRIPILETHVRSLNLATSVGVGLYEAVRQIDGRNGRPMLGITEFPDVE